MATKLYIGGLPYSSTDQDLTDRFGEFGTVVSAVVIKDRDTGRSKGFGFVEFDSEDAAKKAIEQLNGKDFDGRNITVNEARPQEERRPRQDRPSNGGSFRQRY